MASRICRESSLTPDLSLTNSVSTTKAFVMGQDAGGMLHVITAGGGSVATPTTNTEVTIHFYIDPDDSGTRYQLYDSANAVVAQKVNGGRCYPLPDALFGAGKVLMVLSGSSAACIVRVSLKT